MMATSGTSSATDHVSFQKLELDSLLPEVKGRILKHLDHENIFKLKSLSKNWKALIGSVEFTEAPALKAKPVLTACSFFIHKGVWQWAAFDPKWNSTRENKAPSLENLPSNPGRFFWCFILGIVGILTRLNVVGASPTSAPGPSSSQTSSIFPTLWYWGVRATIVAAAIGVIGLCVTIYMCFYPREREDNMCGVLRELTRPFGEGPRSMCVSLGRLKVGEASVDDLNFRSSPGSSPGSSPRSSLV